MVPVSIPKWLLNNSLFWSVLAITAAIGAVSMTDSPGSAAAGEGDGQPRIVAEEHDAVIDPATMPAEFIDRNLKVVCKKYRSDSDAILLLALVNIGQSPIRIWTPGLVGPEIFRDRIGESIPMPWAGHRRRPMDCEADCLVLWPNEAFSRVYPLSEKEEAFIDNTYPSGHYVVYTRDKRGRVEGIVGSLWVDKKYYVKEANQRARP